IPRADTFCDDIAEPVDYERFGNTSHSVGLVDLSTRVEPNREGKPHLLREGSDVSAEPSSAVPKANGSTYADRDDFQTPGPVILIQCLHGGHLFPTRLAPGGPHIQQDDFAAQFIEGNRLAC